MPSTHYKIWKWGGSVGRGATVPHHVAVAGVAKSAIDGEPYVVPNELVCNHLARSILLPTPPGFIVNHEGTPYFVSLNFNLAGEALPPADPVEVIAAKPDLGLGITLFDIWIVNSDRHTNNIAHDQVSGKIEIFDHSHALFRGVDGRSSLENSVDDIGIRAKHCIARELNSFNGIRDWYDRINSVPEFYVTEVIEAATNVGLPADYVTFCTDFLLSRRERLLDLIRDNQTHFPKIQPELWNELNDDNDEINGDEPDEGGDQ